MFRMKNLPEGWRICKIKDTGEVVTGTTPSMKDPQNYGGNLVWIKPPDLDKGKFVSDSEKKISKIGIQKIRLLPPGSVMVSCIGKIGKVAIAGCELCTNQQINSIIPRKNIVHSQFLYYLIRRIQPYLEQISSSAVVPLLNKRNFSNVEIVLPPFNVQKHIARILEDAEQLKFWRKEADKLTEDYLNSVFLKMFGDTKINPKKWKTRKLKEFINKERGISYGVLQRGNNFPNGVPVIRISNIYNNTFNGEEVVYTDPKIEAKYNRSRLVGGELLISIRGTVGKLAIAPKSAKGWNVSREIAVIPLLSKLNRDYFKYLFLSNGIQFLLKHKIRGIAQRGVNLGDLSKLQIPFPPQELQEEFSSIVKNIKQLKTLQKISNQLTDELFQVLMKRAFTGEINC